MSTQKRVLLFIDNSKRDLLGMQLIEEELKRLGAETSLCSHRNLRFKLRSFCPDALIMARGDNVFAKMAAEVCPVYIVPSEGNRLTKETMLSVFMGRSYWKLEDLSWIRRCYLWNQNTEKWLMETGKFKSEQLLVSGNARIEPYMFELDKRTRTSSNQDFVLGVAISAKSTSTYYGEPHFAENYFNAHPDTSFPIAAPGRNFEDLVWRDHAILRNTMRFVKYYLETFSGKVHLRPCPFENPREYAFLEKKYPGRVVVRPNEQLIDWIHGIDAMLTCWSTTGIEGLLREIPVISMSGVIDEDYMFQHIDKVASGFTSFVDFYHKPKSLEEFASLIELAQQKKLATARRSSKDTYDMLHEMYDWPYEQRPSTTIAQDVLADIRNREPSSPQKWKKVFPLKVEMPMIFAKAAYFVKAMYDNWKSGSFWSYYNFHRTKNKDVDRLIKTIQSASRKSFSTSLQDQGVAKKQAV